MNWKTCQSLVMVVLLCLGLWAQLLKQGAELLAPTEALLRPGTSMRLGWSDHRCSALRRQFPPGVKMIGSHLPLCMQINMYSVSVCKDQMCCCFYPVWLWQTSTFSHCVCECVREWKQSKEGEAEQIMCCSQLYTEVRCYLFERLKKINRKSLCGNQCLVATNKSL